MHHPLPLDVVVMPGGGSGAGPAATVGGKAASYTPVPLNPPHQPQQQQSTAKPKRGVCRQYGGWIALLAFFALLLIIAKAVDGQSTDPWAPYRHSLDEGYLKYPGPFTHTGVCGNNLLGVPGDMACGFYDPYPGMFLTGQSSCDASSTAASCLDEKCQIAYSCNLATPFAQCDSIVAGETCSSPLVPPGSTSVRPGCRNAACKCNDICATGPLCNLRRDTAFNAQTKFGVFPTLDCRSLSAGSIKELGVTTVPTPPPCSVFGPLGCNSATRACYRRFAVTEHIGDVCIPRNGWAKIPGVTSPVTDRFVGCTQSGVSADNGKDLLWGLHCDNGGTCPVEGMPCVCPAGFNGVFCTSALPCPRGWGGYRCQEQVGCRNGGCDNGGTCPSSDTVCTCPVGFGGVFCETKCPRGFMGLTCSQNAKCFAGGCDNGGTCPGYGQLCACPVGFGGDVCERICPRGFSGQFCATNVGCKNGGCERGGTCTGSNTTCTCPVGFGGVFCERVCPRGLSGTDCNVNNGCRSGGCDNGGTCYTEPGPYKDRCIACNAGWTDQYCERACKFGECDTALNGTWLPSRILGQAIYPPGTCGITMSCKPPFAGGTPAPFGTAGVDYPCGVIDPAITPVPTYDGGWRCNCRSGDGNRCVMGTMCDQPTKGSIAYWYLPPGQAWTKYDTFQCSTQLWIDRAVNRVGTEVSNRTILIDWSVPCRRHGTHGCNSTELACVKQAFDGTRPIQIGNTTTVQLVPAMEICCPRGRVGDDCEIETGCTVHGCDNGGFCLDRDRNGKRLKPSDTRCFGCNPGTNGTAGWGGRFCNVRMRPTWTWRYNLTGTGWTEGMSARRLLQAGVLAPEPILDRTTTDISRPEAGNIPREEGRICDCGVRWNHSASTNLTLIQTLPLMRFGNYPSNPAEQVLLSPMRFNPDETNAVSGFLHVARSHREAEYKCYLDASSSGYVEFNTTELRARGFFYFGCTFDTRHRRRLHGVARTDGQTMLGVEVAPLLANLTGARWHTIERVPDATLCPDATLDPVFYCATYPIQCQSIRTTGGIGQIKIDAKTPYVATVAFLHYQMFGHRVRNRPNAQCNMGHTLLEDQQGCIFNMRVPDFIPPPLKPNETLTAERCGNLTWIVPERIGGSGVFPVGATAGTNVTDGGVPRCLCDAPFKPTGGNYTDCAFDMCGEGELKDNNTRGAINPLFEVVPLLDKCICKGIWQTDNATCEGNRCDWCNKAGCLNMGSPNLVDPTAACQCLPIFHGKYCELSYCNSTNTLQYAGTGPDIICECKKGWTGPLCHQGACINGGTFNRDTLECVCPPAFTGGQCELPRCKPGYGTWSPEFGKCQCFAPWTGPRCEEHTCDDDNVVLHQIPGWDGMRPFGQPVLVDTPSASLHKCQCNWPYKASVPDDGGEGRPLDCRLHDCNHGVPRRGNSSTWPSNPLAPADMCECVDKAGIGILTDPKLCTEASHNGCPHACLRATCGLKQEVISEILHGQYVQVSSSDASCCECHASVGYQLNSTCQSWCAFYQPCVTTDRSSFAPNPNYNASAPSYYKDDNITRVFDQKNKQYLCACNTHYSNRRDLLTGVEMNDCANYTQPEDDGPVNPDDPEYPPPGSNVCKTFETCVPVNGDGGGGGEESSSSSGLSQTQLIGIVSAAGFAALVGAAQGVSTYLSSKVAQGALDKIVSPSSSSSTGPATTAAARVGGRFRRAEAARLLSLLGMVLLLAVVATGVSAQPFVWPDLQTWAVRGADVAHPAANHMQVDQAAWKWKRLYPGPFGPGDPDQPPDGHYSQLNDVVASLPAEKTAASQYGAAFEIAFDLGTITGGPKQTPGDALNRNAGGLQSALEGSDSNSARCRDTSGLISTATGSPMPRTDAWPAGTSGVIQKERVCPFSLSSNLAVSTVGGMQVRGSDLTWSMFRQVRPGALFPNDGLTTYYALNLCQASAAGLSCGTRGTCVSINAYSLRNDNGFEKRDMETLFLRWKNDPLAYSRLLISVEAEGLYLVRGCKCEHGYYGRLCTDQCPGMDPITRMASISDANKDMHPLCSYHGRCDGQIGTVSTADDPFDPCRCTLCACTPGYSGNRCETVEQTRGEKVNGVVLTNFGACCPLNSPDCSYATNTGQRPWGGAPSPIFASFGVPKPQATTGTTPYGRILTRPDQPCSSLVPNCGRGNMYEVFRPRVGGVSPATAAAASRVASEQLVRRLTNREAYDEFGRDDCGQFEGENADKGVSRDGNGRGQCWTGVGQLDNGDRQGESEAFCWCNSDQYFLNPKTGKPIIWKRRGWFGPGCATRTCTTRHNPVVSVPDADGNPMSLTLQAPLNAKDFPMQCSGNSHGQASNVALKYDEDGHACIDTVERTLLADGTWNVTRINTDGRCKLCIDGFGMYPGYWVGDIDKTSFAKEIGDQGICKEKTYHSTGGGVCGGYWGNVTTKVNQLPVIGGGAGTVPARYISSCDCKPSTLPLLVDAKSGLCRRSCGGTTNVIRIPREFLNENGMYNGSAGSQFANYTSDFCGGYDVGLCRPIEAKASVADGLEVGTLDGYNSACMCNIGYHGPNCVKNEKQWFKGYVCGPDGAAVHKGAIPAGSKYDHVDEWWFNTQIAPLNGERLNDLEPYTMFKCGCKDNPGGPVSRGWEPNKDGICAPTCKSAELMGFNTTTRTNETCTKNGECIDDPTGKTAGKACECYLGWHGDNCATPILRDAFGAVCGGADHGTIEYIDPNNKYSGGQKCRCNAGFGYSKDPLITRGHARYGLCMRECPVSPKTGEPCTNHINGQCILSANDNDRECQCANIAFRGADCGIKLVASYTTKSGMDLPCTGRGIPDDIRMSGGCICDEGYTGFACEMYTGNRACGAGQCFQDNEAAEIFIS